MNAPMRLAHRVRPVDLSDSAQRESIAAFVREQAGSLFHTPAWLIAVESATGHRACGLVSERLGVITGWLPFTQIRSVLFGKALVSSGFGVGGGILAESDEAGQALADASLEYAAGNGFSSIELRGGPIPQGFNPVTDKHCGFESELAKNDEAQLLAIPRKARAEVRKGLKNGLEVRVGSGKEDLAAHYSVYSESVRNLGTPVFPRSLFSRMLEGFAETSDILTVLSDGKPIASVLSFYHQGAVMPFWGGGTFAARAARANEVMYYKLMCHARERGAGRFNFGRSKTGSGPYFFKKNWGFEPQPLSYAMWNAPGEDARDIDPTSAAYARKIALWKKLPLPLANMIGPLIARDLG